MVGGKLVCIFVCVREERWQVRVDRKSQHCVPGTVLKPFCMLTHQMFLAPYQKGTVIYYTQFTRGKPKCREVKTLPQGHTQLVGNTTPGSMLSYAIGKSEVVKALYPKLNIWALFLGKLNLQFCICERYVKRQYGRLNQATPSPAHTHQNNAIVAMDQKSVH